MKSLIVGFGEVGISLSIILEDYKPDILDPVAKVINREPKGSYEIMHVCFPYSKTFIRDVKKYQKKYKPQFTVIHSTVPVGTSRKCGALHSPIIGIHPFLEESLITFTKYLSGENASKVADYFRRAGMKMYLTDKQESTELMKILDTTFYGVCVEYTKDVKEQCEKFGVPFELWSIYTQNYNEGYKKLGRDEFMRPNLVPIRKKIGGHCVRPNAKMLKTKFTSLLDKSS